MSSGSPTALKRWIAFELRAMREEAGRSRPQAAERLGRAVTQIGHLETGRNLPSLPDVEVLLAWYGRPERVEVFRDLIRRARKGRDWWIGFTDAMPEWFGLYLGLEASAVEAASYDAVHVPGLLQTAPYAEAIIRAGERALSEAEIARRTELRMARHALYERQQDPLRVWAVLDEAALRRQVGGPAVLRDQLHLLAELANRPNIDLQLLPASSGAHAGVEGTFTLLTFPPELEGDHGVAYVETRVRGIYYEDPAEILLYRQALTRLQVQALDPEESRDAINRIAQEMT
ncbi:MAG: helix-turn-helix domain-containing protein [Pseudonocardiaceae bacterium]|nr:helix-turn-helix domain-containing protein [Pseudonocardiaceae bacterium]